MKDKRKIIISAINFTEGGPLSILDDCLNFLSENLSQSFQIIALVHSKDLFHQENIDFLEFPASKSSWFKRLYYEYYYFYQISLSYKPYLWFSLHDLTPNVKAQKRAVYCHNPSIFYKINKLTIYYDWKFSVFNLFYHFAYQINIQKNNFVVVQQNWIKEEFSKRFNFPLQKIIVAHPNTPAFENPGADHITSATKVFFFPAFGRVFKNFEVILNACEFLAKQNVKDFKVLLTIDGSENKFTSHLVQKFKHLPNVTFLGKRSREDVFELYRESDCLIFPSKLETWGLPISEFKGFKKPILLVNLPYAKETLGDYSLVNFFGPDDFIGLSKLMLDIIDNNLKFTGNLKQTIPSPFVEDWDNLFKKILNDE